VLESHSNGCQNKKKRGETRPPGSIPIRMYVLCVAEYDGCGNSQQKKRMRSSLYGILGIGLVTGVIMASQREAKETRCQRICASE